MIAKAAKELGILTVAIVTLPFKTEGPKRMKHAYEGIDELRQYVDSLLLINNENIQDIYGKLTLSEAFGKADDILATAAKSIAEVITRDNTVNVDFADVQTVMKDSGIALMGSGRASGDDRAMKVADAALASPLLNHNDIIGARNILINITSGEEEITLEETYLITEYIQTRSGNNADIIWGAGTDEALGQDIEVTIIATGFDIDTLPQSFDRMTSSPLQARIDSSVLQEDVPAGDEVPAEEETPARRDTAPPRPLRSAAEVDAPDRKFRSTAGNESVAGSSRFQPSRPAGSAEAGCGRVPDRRSRTKSVRHAGRAKRQCRRRIESAEPPGRSTAGDRGQAPGFGRQYRRIGECPRFRAT